MLRMAWNGHRVNKKDFYVLIMDIILRICFDVG